MRMTLARFDPDPDDNPSAWHVGFDVELDDGRKLHSVTTVYASKLTDAERATVIAAARDDVLPGLRLQNRPTATPDQSHGIGSEIEIPPAPHTHAGGEEHTH